MISYYTTVIGFLLISLTILCVLVYENDRLSNNEKKRFYLSYILIGLSAAAEWTGIQLNGNENLPVYLLRIVKCMDYILTPLAGAAFISQMRLHNIWSKALTVIVGINIVFQFVSLFTGWMTRIDETHTYSHGPLYPVYIAEYVAIIVIIIIQFLIWGKGYKKQNRFSLYLIMVLILSGILTQEILGREIRTAYIALTVGALMMFIHSSEFRQQRMDEHILEQSIKIKTDALTGLFSRHAYSAALDKYKADMPKKLVAFSIDINGLKIANDTLGHEAGDELICGAADCIRKVFFECGSCYRTGGDEFIVLAELKDSTAEELLKELEIKAGQWKGQSVSSLSLSAGYATLEEHKGFTCEELVREADKWMYRVKEKYYQSSGKESRV